MGNKTTNAKKGERNTKQRGDNESYVENAM